MPGEFAISQFSLKMVAYNLYATFRLVGISLMGAIGFWERSFVIEIIEKKKELEFLYVVSELTSGQLAFGL